MDKVSFQDLIICFFASITAFLIVPILIIGNSPKDFNFIMFEIFLEMGLLLSFVYFFVIALICILLNFFKKHKLSSLFSNFNLFWVSLSGLLLPLAANTGMVDPEINPTDKKNLALFLPLLFIFCILTITRFKNFVYVFIAILISHSSASSIISIYNSGITRKTDNVHPSQAFSKVKNILVISFDGIPGHLVTEIIKENKRYNDEFKDFVVFENAVSQAALTTQSLIGDLYGVLDYKSIGKSMNDVQRKLTSNGFYDDFLHKKVNDIYQHGGYGQKIKKIEIPPPELTISQSIVDTLYIFKYSTIRIWTSKSLNFLRYEKLNEVISSFFYVPSENSFDKIVKKNLKFHQGPKWDLKNVASIEVFKSFVSNIRTNEKNISVRYLHFTFTHFPVDFDEKCTYRSNDKLWHDNNQSEEGVKAESICGIELFITFLNKLKQLDIYDNSLIIFKSDHGKTVPYFSKAPNNLRINNHQYFGFNRFHPTLMVKGIGVNNRNVIFKSELVLLNDIARTTCESSGLRIQCDNIQGVNLLSENLDNGKPYYIYIPKNNKASFEFSDYISVKIPSRNKSLLKSMEDSPLIELSLPN